MANIASSNDKRGYQEDVQNERSDTQTTKEETTLVKSGEKPCGIVEEAKVGGYGSIVVGRRGLSKVEKFFMGRVSNKVVHLAKEMAVWIVS